MREISTSVTFEIKPGETIPMRVARSTRLTVHGATVWQRVPTTPKTIGSSGDRLKLRERERLWLSVNGDKPAQVVFTVIPRCNERVGVDGHREAGAALPFGLARGVMPLR